MVHSETVSQKNQKRDGRLCRLENAFHELNGNYKQMSIKHFSLFEECSLRFKHTDTE